MSSLSHYLPLSKPLGNAKTYLRLDQNQIDEQHDHVMLDILVGEALAPRALRQSHAFAQSTIVGFAVGRVEGCDVLTTSEVTSTYISTPVHADSIEAYSIQIGIVH